MLRPPAAFLLTLAFWPFAASAQEEPPPSRCIAIAEALPSATYASFTAPKARTPLLAEAFVDGDVTITYAGHSTYIIETPAGVRIATDFSGVYGADPLPRVVTMNKAHRTHYSDHPDPAIEYVLRGWNPDGGPARHAVVVDDVYIRNVPTDIRNGGDLGKDGNSIFIFEVAGLCIGHLGHLHHRLEDAHYGAIGRLDILMVPIDGGMTLSLDRMTEITARLYSSMILPMHRHATAISEFTGRMGDDFAVEFLSGRSLTVSLKTLPDRPTIIILDGV
ncbi:MAG: Zn-dependent hydrolase [Mesorhizobium sp.]|uniref:MBL fold metallo-hydrolase n=1 Tax=unclassified Mesorhizobium TaxID=325217 RepID=UPI000FCC1809|nr:MULTISPECIES: MBL fold metallo-hydrolase [unclassified Mesorhizobium]RUV75580.1 Zn-dependent hydrolase [Mesorhizobium sp. M5C.F.Cr.IN.023.01.1.1]RWF54165.1 MAG: Zn-dependent hydrolase [Mesorhizobium sp.]RWF90056.1 MAG: Zn-dependent hydrolase [Mesorhizobium sp.]RWF91657.1 MAG: Zn-dependent hydrolase [Mesorhizobium sp.]RWI41892.1 MAG: Zn-dependent hydrolase [Mesorhizobium sp.]